MDENEMLKKLEKFKEMVEVEIDNRREDLVRTEVYLINEIDSMIYDIKSGQETMFNELQKEAV